MFSLTSLFLFYCTNMKKNAVVDLSGNLGRESFSQQCDTPRPSFLFTASLLEWLVCCTVKPNHYLDSASSGLFALFCNRFTSISSRYQLRSLYNICTILVQYLYVYNCTYIVQLLYIYCTTTGVGMVRVRGRHRVKNGRLSVFSVCLQFLFLLFRYVLLSLYFVV